MPSIFLNAPLNDSGSTPGSADLSRTSPPGHSRTSSARSSGSLLSQCSPSPVELVPYTGAHNPCRNLNAQLILSPCSRDTRPPKLSPGPNTTLNTFPHSAISHQYNSFTSQDVFRDHELVNQRPISHRPGLSPNPGQHVSSHSFLESPRLSSSSTRYVAINSHSARPRTSNQVFKNISDLAAHYGIPQFLPTAPRTTPRRTTELAEPSSSIQSDNLSSTPDFENLISNYLTMLSQEPGANGVKDVRTPDTALVTAVPEVSDADAIQSLMDVLKPTPELQMSNDLNEYLTSPLIDSPFDDDLLTTPAIGSAHMHADILTSPLMGDFGGDSFGEFPSLFDEFSHAVYQPSKPPNEFPTLPHQPNLDAMYRLDSPNTPFLEPSASSPFERKSDPHFSTRRKSNATGTRKNATPESLVPVDAPTQPRKYLTPSATSRKELPAIFARKRTRAAAFDDEEDQLGEDVIITPTMSEQEQIEAKRRQNTVAARRSRKRKLEYQRELEENVEQYKRESEIWKQRAMTCQALLRSHRIDCPEFSDS
ncbi:hypothetical protein BS17DRAFT_782859 [Gyrodon lividus]|nr:hypothetical protein BS17DRAFT_782859 [Gyrodon lividus]